MDTVAKYYFLHPHYFSTNLSLHSFPIQWISSTEYIYNWWAEQRWLALHWNILYTQPTGKLPFNAGGYYFLEQIFVEENKLYMDQIPFFRVYKFR